MAVLNAWTKDGPLDKRVYTVEQDLVDDDLLIPLDAGYIGEVSLYGGTSHNVAYTTIASPTLESSEWIGLADEATESTSYPLNLFATALKVTAVGTVKVVVKQVKGGV